MKARNGERVELKSGRVGIVSDVRPSFAGTPCFLLTDDETGRPWRAAEKDIRRIVNGTAAIFGPIARIAALAMIARHGADLVPARLVSELAADGLVKTLVDGNGMSFTIVTDAGYLATSEG